MEQLPHRPLGNRSHPFRQLRCELGERLGNARLEAAPALPRLEEVLGGEDSAGQQVERQSVDPWPERLDQVEGERVPSRLAACSTPIPRSSPTGRPPSPGPPPPRS